MWQTQPTFLNAGHGLSGLTARDRGLGTGILVHEAVCSPGGSHLPPPMIHTAPYNKAL